ncbi:hypothetical protein [Klebsiella pneumoniae IS46]|nr:hypothetical protein [Klebsiella pneumoniae IS46]
MIFLVFNLISEHYITLFLPEKNLITIACNKFKLLDLIYSA